MAIIHDEHCHVPDHKKMGDSDPKNTGKGSDAGSRSSGHNPGVSSLGGVSKKMYRDITKSGNERSSDSSGTGKQPVREPTPCLLFCRPDQCSLTSGYVDNNSSLISE
jgi:hypothetical protein